MTTIAAGWVYVGAWDVASTSLAWANQFCCRSPGWLFFFVLTFFYIGSGNCVTSFDWGSFGSFCEW